MPTKQPPSLKPVRPGAIPFWMLNDASSVTEKIEYLRQCHRGGYEAMAMHPRAGNLVPYASTEWFDMVAALVEEGRRLGMDLWLYDEDPFPSGAGGGLVMAEHPELQAHTMAWVECPPSLDPGALWRIAETPVLWAGLVSERAPRRMRDLTDQVGPVRSEWFMCPWDSRYYYDETPFVDCPRGSAVHLWYSLRVPAIPKGFRLGAVTLVRPGIDGPWGSLPDLLNPAAFERFRALILDRYTHTVGRHYGRTIPGIFTDEAKPHGGWPVTPDLWREFVAQHGYDLRRRLPRLFGAPLDELDAQTRLDYRGWVSRRFLDAFVRPYRAYCDSVGLRLVGHFSPEDDPIAEAMSLQSVMPIMRTMTHPGTDIIIPLVGDARSPTLNLGSVRAASLRSRYETSWCFSETLALSDWTATTRLSRKILAWQKVLGIDRFFFHGFYSASEGVQRYEAPPDYGPKNSVFAGMCELNAWLKRIEQRMDGAVEQAPVAILNSLYSHWMTGGGQAVGDRQKKMRTSLWQTLLNVLKAHVGVQVVDESEFAAAQVNDGCLTVGRRRYSTLLVPDMDAIGQRSIEALERMAQQGGRVVHFGRGARHMLAADGTLRPLSHRPGECRREAWPSLAWCRRELPAQARLTGRDAEDCFVRRFLDTDGNDCLLAVNLADKPGKVQLRPTDEKTCWQGLEVDGPVERTGLRTTWQVPPGGCGLFQSVPVEAAPSRSGPGAQTVKTLSLEGLNFRRLDVNCARLTSTLVSRPDRSDPLALEYPQPYWQCFDDYRSQRTLGTFMGPMPLDGLPATDTIAYRFEFEIAGKTVAPRLVLDPRCGRGQARIEINGALVRQQVLLPLQDTQPRRLPLKRHLKQGINQLVVTFRLTSPLDGLLSELYLEGDFNVETDGGHTRLTPAAHLADLRGWQAAGLPHYMGRGRYRWSERIAIPEGASEGWVLELDDVVDSAECRVNGRSAGRRAWAPWQWQLPPLKSGKNEFELIASGTAGNRHALHRPAQPQGWLGGGKLWRRA